MGLVEATGRLRIAYLAYGQHMCASLSSKDTMEVVEGSARRDMPKMWCEVGNNCVRQAESICK